MSSCSMSIIAQKSTFYRKLRFGLYIIIKNTRTLGRRSRQIHHATQET